MLCGLPATDDPIEGARPLYHCEAAGCGSSFHLSCLRTAQQPRLAAPLDAAIRESALCPACQPARCIAPPPAGDPAAFAAAATRGIPAACERVAGARCELAVPHGADMLEVARLQQIMQGLDPARSFDLTEELQLNFIEVLLVRADGATTGAAEGTAAPPVASDCHSSLSTG